MIAGLNPYTELKNSGVPWLGEVPIHWDVKRLKQICRLVYGDALAADIRRDGMVQVYGSNGPVGAHFKSNTEAPCIVIGRKGSFGKVAFSSEPVFAIDTTFFIDGRSTTANLRWLFYLLGWLRLDAISKDSAVPGLDREDAYQRIAAVPSRLEQAAIVRFLDHADRRIRRYIGAKQKLIKLLEEQKQAIVHRAVTRGLDPSVRLKPSGVEWMDDVPVHWQVRRLHQITDLDRRVMYGIVLPGPNVDEGVFIVKGGNCEPGRLRRELLSRTTFEIESRYARSRLAASDIVFAIRGSVGAADLVPPELAGANVTQDAARIAPGRDVLPRWLLFAVQSPIFRAHVQSQVVGATVRGINIRDLKRIELVVPPVEEQARMVAHLEQATRHVVEAAARARREIQILREYRVRLIAEVVTGKLDVREAAARLPDGVQGHDAANEADAAPDSEDALDDLDFVTEDDAT